MLVTLAPSRSLSPSTSIYPLPSLSNRTKYSPGANPPADSLTLIFSRYFPLSSRIAMPFSTEACMSSCGFTSTVILAICAPSSATNFGSTTSRTPSPSQSSPASSTPFPLLSSIRSIGTVPTFTNPLKISVQVPALLQPIARISKNPITVTILNPMTHFRAT